TFGFRAASTFHAYGARVTPHATLGYRHAFGLTVPTTHERFAAGSQTYGMDVAGVALSRDAAVVDAGVAVRLTDRIDVGLSYMGQYGGL
ncbi:autotransporter outer membrane beta-barrel domain-containing protein, partial [Gluconobacter kondonii]|uniref:autotransporter outer membrane beta-barrel domain-containing protein n=1 Tax=Gluconobacter kondonii TaxID=941463 RepID=UPI00222F10F7